MFAGDMFVAGDELRTSGSTGSKVSRVCCLRRVDLRAIFEVMADLTGGSGGSGKEVRALGYVAKVGEFTPKILSQG